MLEIIAALLFAVSPTADAQGLPPCRLEDDTMCVWDAQTQGNGIGQSFISLAEGVVIYF